MTSVVFLPEMHVLNLVMKKRQTNPNERTFYKIVGQYSLNISRSWKTKNEELVQIKID